MSILLTIAVPRWGSQNEPLEVMSVLWSDFQRIVMKEYNGDISGVFVCFRGPWDMVRSSYESNRNNRHRAAHHSQSPRATAKNIQCLFPLLVIRAVPIPLAGALVKLSVIYPVIGLVVINHA